MGDITTTVVTYLLAYGEPDGPGAPALIACAWPDDTRVVDPLLTGLGPPRDRPP